VLLRQIIEARIMSKAWAEKNKVEKSQDYKAKEETFAARNANGTGPYKLKTWQADVKIELTANKDWWDKMEGNVDEVIFTPGEVRRHARLGAALRRRRHHHRSRRRRTSRGCARPRR
jgi:ABC-type transport system substrate-binding protein